MFWYLLGSDGAGKASVYILYIQMQLYEQETLKEWLDSRTTIDVQDNKNIIKQVTGENGNLNNEDIGWVGVHSLLRNISSGFKACQHIYCEGPNN